MEVPIINDWSDFKHELEKLSARQSGIILTRSVMRILPVIGKSERGVLGENALLFFRFLSIAHNSPHLLRINANVSTLESATDSAGINAANSQNPNGPNGSTFFQNHAIHLALKSLFSAMEVMLQRKPSVQMVLDVMEMTAEVAAAIGGHRQDSGPDSPAIWKNLLADVRSLTWDNVESVANGALLGRRMWWDERPKLWIEKWTILTERLLQLDPNFSVWIEWYRFRIRGKQTAFDIPGDRRRVEDKKILRRLAEATDEDFWGKGHEYVNAELARWLEEARERAAKNLPQPDIATEIEVPSQEPHAIAYGVNNDGMIDRLPHTDQQHLRDTPSQRRDYVDLREMLSELLEEGQRLGPRLARGLERLNSSMPERFEDALVDLVWRDGNALRRQYWAHRKVENSPEPDPARLEAAIAEGLGGMLDLFNNFAFADDGLRAKDERRIPIQEQGHLTVEAEAAKAITLAVLASPDIATDRALADIAAEVEDEALPADEAYFAQALDQSNGAWRNRVAAVLVWAKEKLPDPATRRGATGYGIAGNILYETAKTGMPVVASSCVSLLEFIALNGTILTNYVAIAFQSYPHLPELIAQAKHLWQRISGKG